MDLDPLDLSFLNRSQTGHLQLNDANGNFVGEAPGFGYSGPSTNMAWVDYDNDGDLPYGPLRPGAALNSAGDPGIIGP